MYSPEILSTTLALFMLTTDQSLSQWSESAKLVNWVCMEEPFLRIRSHLLMTFAGVALILEGCSYHILHSTTF